MADKKIRLKRAYDEPEDSDGYRILVDRLWPRGVSKADLRLDAWHKELAPSDDLRREFHDASIDFEEFKQLYHAELDQKGELMDDLLMDLDGHDVVTFVFAKKNRKQNNAVVLKEYLENLSSQHLR
jgi:uncharacterized protein YeaO (DUF488 family)